MKKYDVIIVGSGVAGCFAALNLPETYNILMITKAGLEESDSYLAQGGICVKKDEDDSQVFLEDTMKAGHYENNRESVQVMIDSSQEIIKDLISYGVRFQKENDRLKFTREGGHSVNRILYYKDATGREITSKLLEAVKHKSNVEIHDHAVMLDILELNNQCYGIIMKKEDEPIRQVVAPNTIWACGGIGGVFDSSTNYAHLTGDAIAISIKRNIELKDIDYIQIHPTTLYSKKKGKRFLISESVRGEGAILLDKEGNRFVDELLPRDKVAAAIYEQMKKDDMPHVWLSMEKIDEKISQRFPNIYERCLEEGYDPEKQSIPVVPAQHYLMGGVKIDLDGKTSMDYLYAAGETCNNGVHGANRLASNSLLESLVFAKRAANAIQRSRDRSIVQIDFEVPLEQYEDLDAYNEKQRQLILDTIDGERKKKHESDYNKTQCG